ncbi:MAG: squalene synthase HpnC [Planctomycetaceae bacterium]
MSTVPVVSADLQRWGPDRSYPSVSVDEAQLYARELAQSHYENFPVVTWLLPRKLHQHFYNVYAFCRWADDLGDEIGDPAESLRMLSWWRDELTACYQGEPRHPVFVALRPTVERFGIPVRPFQDLISAFEQDQRVTEYETFEQLRDYCRRSADPVGRIVLYLCESFTERAAEWSDSVCTGLQLANMWQDVNRDLDIGRIYLPREDRERCGYTEGELRSRTTNAAFLKLMRFEVDRARDLLVAGLPVADAVPGRLKVDIELFAQGGLAILREIERIDYRVWDRRPKLTKGHFAALLLRTLWRRATRHFGKSK